jgi:outer membrane protein assembly factor BamB
LATPAVVDGKVFLGGGFGSYEFYALDAKTGKLLWQYRTGDDGPTAAHTGRARTGNVPK